MRRQLALPVLLAAALLGAEASAGTGGNKAGEKSQAAVGEAERLMHDALRADTLRPRQPPRLPESATEPLPGRTVAPRAPGQEKKSDDSTGAARENTHQRAKDVASAQGRRALDILLDLGPGRGFGDAVSSAASANGNRPDEPPGQAKASDAADKKTHNAHAAEARARANGNNGNNGHGRGQGAGKGP